MPAVFLSTVAGSGSTPTRSPFADARRSVRLWSRPFRRRPGLQPTPAACRPTAVALILTSCHEALAGARVSCVGLHRGLFRGGGFCTCSSPPFHHCLKFCAMRRLSRVAPQPMAAITNPTPTTGRRQLTIMTPIKNPSKL